MHFMNIGFHSFFFFLPLFFSSVGGKGGIMHALQQSVPVCVRILRVCHIWIEPKSEHAGNEREKKKGSDLEFLEFLCVINNGCCTYCMRGE